MSQTRYEVLGKIAEGGLGSVFKAYDKNLRREVAIKRVRADTQEETDRQADQLFEEARTISTLQHPHIVTVFDVGKDEEGAYIVMELLKGETLEDIIQRGALNEGDFRELVSQSIEGMIAAHATGLIHLDIKPQNFMMIWLPSGKFQVKILDFGLAKVAHQPTLQEVDEDGSVLGSIFFMAPEQFERSPVDARTDLYSLGCVYYFALTQQYPFQGDTAPEVMASHLYHSRVPLEEIRPDLPRWLTSWVEWLMMRDPNQRPVTATQAFEWFQASQVPSPDSLNQPFTDDGTVALAMPEEDEYTATALSEEEEEEGSPRQPTPSQPMPLRFERPVPRTQSGRVGRPAPRPIMRPVNIAAAIAPEHLRERKPLPKWLVLGVPLVLVVLFGGFFGYKYISKARAEGRFEALQSMQPARGTVADVNLLIGFLEDPERSHSAAEVLSRIEAGDSVNTLLSRYVSRAKSDMARKNLASAIASRRAKEATDPMLEQLDQVKDKETRLAYWHALGRTATPFEIPTMIQKLATATTDEFRPAETSLVTVAKQDVSAESASKPFLEAYRAKSGSDEYRASLLRVLARLGSGTALKELTDALGNSNPLYRNAAAQSLGDWPNAEPVPALVAFIPAAKDPYIRLNAINSLSNLVTLSGVVPLEEIAKVLIAARSGSKDSREQTAILSALGRVAAPAALDFFRKLPATEPQSKQTADTAVKHLGRLLDRVVKVSGASTELETLKADLTQGPLTVTDGIIMRWAGISDHVGWLLKVEQPGEYEVKLSQAYTGSKPGRYAVTLGNKVFPKNVEPVKAAGEFREVTVGKVVLPKAGHYRLWIRPLQMTLREDLMQVKQVVLTRTGG